jgi:hypothetical protein
MRWAVNATPRPLYPLKRPGTHCIGGRVDPGLFWMGMENLAPTGIRSPDRLVRSENVQDIEREFRISVCSKERMRTASTPARATTSQTRIKIQTALRFNKFIFLFLPIFMEFHIMCCDCTNGDCPKLCTS